MLNLHFSTLAAVVEQALADAADHPRWITAIQRAFEECDSNPYIERAGHGLLIGSPSGSCYAANGTCGCTSYTGYDNGTLIHAGGRPCWHRACARIVRRYDEAQASLMTMAEGDTLDTSGMRVQRPTVAKLLAAARARIEMDELFA